MREFALSGAQPSLQAEAFPIRLLRDWRARRRQLFKLLNHKSLSLADVGLTSSDVEQASHMPLREDRFLALELRCGWRFGRASLDKIVVMGPIGRPPLEKRSIPSKTSPCIRATKTA